MRSMPCRLPNAAGLRRRRRGKEAIFKQAIFARLPSAAAAIAARHAVVTMQRPRAGVARRTRCCPPHLPPSPRMQVAFFAIRQLPAFSPPIFARYEEAAFSRRYSFYFVAAASLACCSRRTVRRAAFAADAALLLCCFRAACFSVFRFIMFSMRRFLLLLFDGFSFSSVFIFSSAIFTPPFLLP